MTRQLARETIDEALSIGWEGSPIRATLAVAEATFYVGEQLERIADILNGGAYIERTDYGTTVSPKEHR